VQAATSTANFDAAENDWREDTPHRAEKFSVRLFSERSPRHSELCCLVAIITRRKPPPA
jgi:hypothetical protein